MCSCDCKVFLSKKLDPLGQTKKLWIDRLNRENALVESSPLPTPTSKPPQRLRISYPFGTSPLLQEQVSFDTPVMAAVNCSKCTPE